MTRLPYRNTPARRRGVSKIKFDLSVPTGYRAPRKGHIWVRSTKISSSGYYEVPRGTTSFFDRIDDTPQHSSDEPCVEVKGPEAERSYTSDFSVPGSLVGHHNE